MDEKTSKELKDISIDGTLPHQISAPDYKNSSQEIQKPFINEHGVVIGDSYYSSANSPLQQWDTDTDPAEMAGDEWVHPTNDIGWNSTENKELLEDIPPKGQFMHPTLDVSKGRD